MAILAINTASLNTQIALLNDEKTKILIEKSWKSQNNEAELLMPEIQNIMKSSLLDWKDISEVFVVKGPGSFTGLRIGVVVANTLKYLLKTKLSSINTFEYLWSAMSLQNDSDNFTPASASALLIFAGQRGVYFSASEKDTSEDAVKLLSLEDLLKHLKAQKIQNYFGDISNEQKHLLQELNFIEIKASFGETVLNILQNKIFKDEEIIYPVYVKAPAISKAKNKIF